MTSYMGSPEKDIKSREDNVPDITLSALYTHLLEDNQIIRENVSEHCSLFSANTFMRFMCAFQIGSLFQIS